MNIEELTIKQAREVFDFFGQNSQQEQHPFKIGANYLIRTVTMIQAGKLVAVGNKELVMEDASWIADTGRFQQALETGNFNEVEMFPRGKLIIGRGALIDAVEINNIPTSQK